MTIMIEFTRDYRGKRTQERFFAIGTQTDEFDEETVEYLVSVQAAVVVAPKRGRPKKETE